MFQNLKLNNSLDTLNIITFWKILRYENPLLLDVSYKEGKYYTKNDLKRIKITFERLYDEYYRLRGDALSKMLLNDKYEAIKYARIINNLKHNIDFLISLKSYEGLSGNINVTKFENETYQRVLKINQRMKIKPLMGIDYNVGVISKFILSLTNRINEINTKQKQEDKKQEVNFYETIANAESWLERGLDVDKIVVSHWLAIEKQIKLKSEAQKKQKNGNR